MSSEQIHLSSPRGLAAAGRTPGSVMLIAAAFMLFAGPRANRECQAQIPYRIAASESGPGYAGHFGEAVINSSRRVAFRAGTGFDGGIGWQTDASGALDLVAQHGAPIPGPNGDVELDFLLGPMMLSDDNRVGLFGLPDSSNLDQFGIWSGPPPELNVVAFWQNQAPGLPDGVYFRNAYADGHNFEVIDGTVGFSKAGKTAFFATLAGPGIGSANNGSVWSDSTGPLSLVAREGEQAPGVENGTVFGTFGKMQTLEYGTLNPPDPAINPQGDIAFAATLSGGPASQRGGIWVGRNGDLRLAARNGEQVGGLDPAIRASMFGNPAMNNDGDIAFASYLAGSGVNSGNNSAVLSKTDGILRAIAREGDRAPGTPTGVVFQDFRSEHAPGPGDYATSSTDPAISDNGLAVFLAMLSGGGVNSGNDIGIWSAPPDGPLTLVAREGDLAPGAGDDVYFDTINYAGYATDYWGRPRPGFALNGRGQIAFSATLRGEGVTYSNDAGIWATDRHGNLQLVMREGDEFSLPGAGAVTRLHLLTGSGGSDGRPSSFNDRGELAFSVGAYGGAAVAVAMIPEPSTALLLLLLSVCVAARRARRGRASSRINL